MTTPSSLPLFCFGSLMEPEVIALVSGCPLSQLRIVDAVAYDHSQREVVEESFPILVPNPGASARGRLVHGLTDLAMDRIRFFEGDEYVLDAIEVHTDGQVQPACWFRDTGAYQDTGREWSFARWRAEGSDAFVNMTRQYMALHGTMTIAEADAHWEAIVG